MEYFVESMIVGLWLVPNSSLYNSLPNLTGLGEITRAGLYPCNGTYRFELIDMNTTFARFNVSLDLNAWRPHKRFIAPGEEIIWIGFKMLQTSFIYDVDLETLTTYKDGRVVGIFPLWRGFTSQRGQVPLFLSFFGRRIDANYTFLENYIPCKTPLGTFRYVFVVYTEAKAPPLPYVNLTRIFLRPNNVYDRDSFLLVSGREYMDEILLDNGIMCFDEIKVRETTVEFPQLKESGFEVQGWQVFLGLLLAGIALPLIYKLFRRIRILGLLVWKTGDS